MSLGTSEAVSPRASYRGCAKDSSLSFARRAKRAFLAAIRL
jgi:hypothetical protein